MPLLVRVILTLLSVLAQSALSIPKTCAEIIRQLGANHRADEEPTGLKIGERAHQPGVGPPHGRFVMTPFRHFFITLPKDGLPEQVTENLSALSEMTRVAGSQKAGEGPLAALRQLEALGGDEKAGLKIRRGPRWEVAASWLSDAKRDRTDAGDLFQKLLDDYQDRASGAAHYSPRAPRETVCPFSLQVKDGDRLRDLSLSDPLERSLAESLFRLSLEEVLHQVSHQARGFSQVSGGETYQLLTVEARAFAEWLATHPEQVSRYLPELEERYGRAPSIEKLAVQLGEADVTAWLAAHGMPHSEIEIGKKGGRPYAARRLLQLYLRDVAKHE